MIILALICIPICGVLLATEKLLLLGGQTPAVAVMTAAYVRQVHHTLNAQSVCTMVLSCAVRTCRHVWGIHGNRLTWTLGVGHQRPPLQSTTLYTTFQAHSQKCMKHALPASCQYSSHGIVNFGQMQTMQQLTYDTGPPHPPR